MSLWKVEKHSYFRGLPCLIVFLPLTGMKMCAASTKVRLAGAGAIFPSEVYNVSYTVITIAFIYLDTSLNRQ